MGSTVFTLSTSSNTMRRSLLLLFTECSMINTGVLARVVNSGLGVMHLTQVLAVVGNSQIEITASTSTSSQKRALYTCFSRVVCPEPASLYTTWMYLLPYKGSTGVPCNTFSSATLGLQSLNHWVTSFYP